MHDETKGDQFQRGARGFVAVLVLAAVLTGCVGAEFRPTPTAPAFEPYTGEVKVLGRLPPAGRFERVGVVIAEGVKFTSKSTMLEQLKREAAARGANAIVLQSDVKTTPDSEGGERKKLAAWALRLK